MISTRGVKFKFSTGEKVLCYEPDPTKAKVLYESKVLDLVANRDGRGRKICEYLIHFYGWNSSWDRFVREEFILPYTEENRTLQAKLAEEAAQSLKGKKKHKLPPLIKETLSKKMCTKNDGLESKQPKTPSHSSSDSESSEDEGEREVNIIIPDVLKTILERDSWLVTQGNKFIRLPCEKNVINILEDYVKDHAAYLLLTTPPKNVKNGQKLMPEDVKNQLNLCKEAMDGLRVFFDFTLPHLLLYRQEKKQYYTIGLTCSPVYDPRSFKHEPVSDNEKKKERTNQEILDSIYKEFAFLQENPEDSTEEENLDYKKAETEAAIRNLFQRYRLNVSSNLNDSLHVDGEASIQSEASAKSLDIKPQEQSPKEKSPKKTKKKEKRDSSSEETSPKCRPTRVLRSSDRLKQQPPPSDELSLSVNLEMSDNSSFAPSPKIPESSPEPVSTLRVTRKSGQNALSSPVHQQASPSSVSCDRSVPNSPTSSIPNVEYRLPQSVASNYFSSSNSSTHSTASDIFLKAPQYHLMNNSSLVQEFLEWRMVPEYLYKQIPAAPSLIYGAHHLLRLFVKLPALISKMNMKQKKLEQLLHILERFLDFLAQNSDGMFSPSAYIDAYDVFPISQLGMMY